jgi:hypothetical protein
MKTNLTKSIAMQHISYIADDGMSFRRPAGLPCDVIPDNAVLVGWEIGGRPVFVAVKSYLPGVRLGYDEALELATDGMVESGALRSARLPDYVIG